MFTTGYFLGATVGEFHGFRVLVGKIAEKHIVDAFFGDFPKKIFLFWKNSLRKFDNLIARTAPTSRFKKSARLPRGRMTFTCTVAATCDTPGPASLQK
ncbi:hypothetical protein Zmor_012835 [Zophobas morio]|uniref:Uncharacterized protein n=1 Tax=Zophobas morio TaxID=2755281 RepID=A0AA38I9R2_9CUCU|nr:hypothetical protein Zmor_012832 [Zophobas morio]KAJ3653593.1 hypothetical protein Zmor_012835 [Zophobas morio]